MRRQCILPLPQNFPVDSIDTGNGIIWRAVKNSQIPAPKKPADVMANTEYVTTGQREVDGMGRYSSRHFR